MKYPWRFSSLLTFAQSHNIDLIFSHCWAKVAAKQFLLNQNNWDQICGRWHPWLSGLHHACDLCHRRGSLGRPCATETGRARRGHRTHGVTVTKQAHWKHIGPARPNCKMFDESYCQSWWKWGLDSCCCWWSWFGCYPIRKVCGSRDFRHCRGWGRLGITSSLILLWLWHFDSLKGLVTWRVFSQIWLLVG